MKTSAYLQTVRSQHGALCYNSLYGNLFFVEPDYLAILDSFASPRKIAAKKKSKKVQELIDARYLVQDDEDERRDLSNRNNIWVAKAVGGGQLQLLNLIISEACNFGCEHCLHFCSVKTNSAHGKKKLMDWDVAKQAIDEYARLLNMCRTAPLDIHFGSAEPLLNWPVLTQAAEYARVVDPSAQLSLNTNLSLVTEEMAKFFRRFEIQVSTSLDGPQEGNDAIRVFRDGRGTFDVIMDKFDLFKKLDYPLDGFSITINDRNFDSVTPAFLEWAHKKGMSGIATDIDMINTEGASNSVDKCVAKLMELKRACSKLGLENFGSWTTAYDNLVNEPEDGVATFCRSAKGQNISINPEGQVFICGHTTTVMGDLENIDAVFASGSPYLQTVKSRLPGNNDDCRHCELEGVCAGQCQITQEVSSATGNKRDRTMCEIYRKATHELLKDKLERELLERR